MADPKNTEEGVYVPPTPTVTYTNPRRIAPEKSITLRHHRLARDSSRRHPPPTIPNAHSSVAEPERQTSIVRRNSSDESNETKWSEPRLWFEESNQNAKDTLETSEMDIDPPFFQKETDSSNEETNNRVPSLPVYGQGQSRGPSFRPSVTKSSSADDYRSVIDDLTIENKRLREELRKFKQMGPNSLRNDKLFEVKVHGLPSKKKRELEATLRDFTTKLERSSTGASTSRKRASGKSKEGNSSGSKHTSSTSGSNSRPVDSAYASMETGQSSSNPQPGQARAARLRSNQNIQQYLRDIPEGLWPRPAKMTDHEKKKLVVKRLEHLFTGKMGHPKDEPVPALMRPPAAVTEDVEMEDNGAKLRTVQEAAREAIIRTGDSRKKTSHSSTGASASNTRTQSQSQSNADQSNSRDNDKDSGSGSGRSAKEGKNTSPQDSDEPFEQRPTRPRDLDPDRKQVPADNMEYIRHLGIVAPESEPYYSSRDVSPDAEGWVYLNLLGNLAQLHILNVTPDFIRSAVSEKSTKFQLSPDGRKIRWRGGDEGTRFTSDSGSKSQTSRSGDDSEDGSNEQNQRKKPKGSKFNLGVQNSNSSQDFHYKPLFVHHPTSLPDGQLSSVDESYSSLGQSEDSNGGMRSRWAQSGVSPEQSQQRKRRRDGAIIYYSGAPFCTDLSGDYGEGEVSADTYDMTSSDDQQGRLRRETDPVQLHLVHRPYVNRSPSGSFIQIKPLSEPMLCSITDHAESMSSEDDSGIEADFSWSDSDQQSRLTNLEASGLGGTYPDDHFVVVVSTRRPKNVTFYDDDDDGDDDGDASSDEDRESLKQRQPVKRMSHDTTTSRETADSIASRMATISTTSPMAKNNSARRVVKIKIEYVASETRRLPPVPLPPPTFFFRSGDSEDTEEYGPSLDDDVSVSSERSVLSKRPMLEGSPGSDNRDLSGNDEEDDFSDSSPSLNFEKKKPSKRPSRMSGTGSGGVPLLSKVHTGSSAATAGGAGSGYYSSMEDA
ncbi:frequency clock protein [Xylaria bambusicola]|uniref:frequency clock protein n=1 Tax=Xylaria bambusicola TaxID=326684 RepID=UPI002007B75C|nr:frequency clock protein [Xylaria bambusicola]KAI0506538.1 frequency clock protein [Xylaria bambusicola]